MTIDANRLEGLKVDFKVADLWGAKIVSGFAQLARAEVGGQSITGVKLTATGNASASDLELSGNARGLAINARGRLFGGPPTRFELASFAAQGGGQRITLAGPATVTYGANGLDIKDLALRVGAGRLSLSGHSGSTLALKASAAALPLIGARSCSRPASVCPASPTARRRSGERQAIRPANGACVCSAWSRRKCATPACRRLTSRAPAGSREGGRRLTWQSMPGRATPCA